MYKTVHVYKPEHIVWLYKVPPGKKGREREGKKRRKGEGDGKMEGNERRRVREVKGRHGG